MASDAAVEAIKFALKTDEGMEFLRCWAEGDFASIRKEWPDCPPGVFVGAEVVPAAVPSDETGPFHMMILGTSGKGKSMFLDGLAEDAMSRILDPLIGLPDEGLVQVDALYRGLKAASSLLAQGRRFGLEVGISPSVAAIIRARHGVEAEAVLANVRTFSAAAVSAGE